MLTHFSKKLIASAILVCAASASHAQVLVSADNGAATTYTSNVNAFYPLDGTNTALSFTTTKANEAVTLSFAAARCGVEQTAAQSVTKLNESGVQGFFYIDGSVVPTATGNANTLCYYDLLPQAQYMLQFGAAQMQQTVIVPAKGKHSISVLFQVLTTNDGTQIWPVFGQSHVSVAK